MTDPKGVPSLESLSEAATPGPWTVFDVRGIVEIQAQGQKPVVHWSGFDQAIGGIARRRADARLAVRLINDFRANRLHTDEALAQAIDAARGETETMAIMLADCVAVLQQIPLNQLPGKVDMMLFAALDAPIQGDVSRAQLAERAAAIRDTQDAAEREEGRKEVLSELTAKAEGQLAHWRRRMGDEKTIEDGVSEDGSNYTPIGDEAAWSGGYCNGRLSEADWWSWTIRALIPTKPQTDTASPADGGRASLSASDASNHGAL